MTADPRALTELLEESQDLQADALRPTHDALDELVESQPRFTVIGRRAGEPRLPRGAPAVACAPSFGGATLLGAAGGAALVGLLASAASASSSSDVQILQTAASIENLAVATYKTALTLPYIGGSAANPVVTKFAQVTMGQHAQHADAFNAAVKHLGGKASTSPTRPSCPVVNKAVASLSGATAAQGALGVVGLALELENIAAETYVKDTVLAKSTTNKALFASIMGIEAQHVSVLLAVQALLDGGCAPAHLAVAGHRRRASRGGRIRWVPQCVLQDQHGRPGQARSRQVSQATQGRLRGLGVRAARHDQGARRAPPRRRHAGHGARASRT